MVLSGGAVAAVSRGAWGRKAGAIKLQAAVAAVAAASGADRWQRVSQSISRTNQLTLSALCVLSIFLRLLRCDLAMLLLSLAAAVVVGGGNSVGAVCGEASGRKGGEALNGIDDGINCCVMWL